MKNSVMRRRQGCHSDFGSNKERKKDSRQGKKTPGKDLTKTRKPLSRQNSTKKCVYSRTIIKIQQEVCEIEELVPHICRKKTCFMQYIIQIYGTTAN